MFDPQYAFFSHLPAENVKNIDMWLRAKKKPCWSSLCRQFFLWFRFVTFVTVVLSSCSSWWSWWSWFRDRFFLAGTKAGPKGVSRTSSSTARTKTFGTFSTNWSTTTRQIMSQVTVRSRQKGRVSNDSTVQASAKASPCSSKFRRRNPKTPHLDLMDSRYLRMSYTTCS